MTRVPALRIRRGRGAAIAYMLSVLLLTGGLLVLVHTGLLPAAAVILIAMPLGPIGLLAAVLLLVLGGLLGGTPIGQSEPVIDLVVLGVVGGIAVLNVVLARRLVAVVGRRPVPAAYRSRVPIGWDRLLGGSGFVLAGAALVLLCFLAGFTILVAHGVDVRVPAAEADRHIAIASVCGATGLSAAIAGVVAWIATWARGRPSLPWAAADLAVQLAAIVTTVVTLG